MGDFVIEAWSRTSVPAHLKPLETRAVRMALKAFGGQLMPELRHDRRGRRCIKCGVETLWCTRERTHIHPACAGY